MLQPTDEIKKKCSRREAVEAICCSKGKLDRIQSSLGYTFKDIELLKLALRHKSMSPQKNSFCNCTKNTSTDPIEGRCPKHSNERLEFLGDRVLGLITAHMLYQGFPLEAEGTLAVRLSNTVRTESLTLIAEKNHLEEAIVRDEKGSCKKISQSMMADTLEAIIGATYLDGGLTAAFTMVEGLISDFLESSAPAEKDAKTKLQEWAHKRKMPLPLYAVVSRTGPEHEPIFEVEVSLANQKSYIGCGNGKKVAEQNAAQEALKNLLSEKDCPAPLHWIKNVLSCPSSLDREHKETPKEHENVS